MRKLLATATVAATLAAGSIGAAAAGATPSPSGNAYGSRRSIPSLRRTSPKRPNTAAGSSFA